jgi:hypothetical protein
LSELCSDFRFENRCANVRFFFSLQN